MDPTNYLGRNILTVLQEIEPIYPIVSYQKIEDSEFIEVPEEGFYLQSKKGNGVISDFRIFFEKSEKYFPSKPQIRGQFKHLALIRDFETMFGAAKKNVPAVAISGAQPTLPGKVFEKDDLRIIAYSANGNNVDCVHVKVTF